MITYIQTQGAKIVREGQHLLVRKDLHFKETLFLHKLEQLVLIGNVELTRRALGHLCKHQIDTVFLTKTGRFVGRIEFENSKNIFLRKEQFEADADQSFSFNFARSVVLGKLSNMATLLMRVSRARKLEPPKKNAVKIRELFEKIGSAESIASLRGYEGRAAALYFEVFQCGFTKPVNFTGRVRRPPTDPVNSVLSLLYTFLMNRVYAAVRQMGLDPYLGHLHALDYGRYSLVLDLMEEFRSIVVDTLVFSLFNMGILKSEDFIVLKESEEAPDSDNVDEQVDVRNDPLGHIAGPASAGVSDLPSQKMATTPVETSANGKYPVQLKPEAMKKTIDAFEQKLQTRFMHPLAEKEMSYAQAIRFQAQHYRDLIEKKYTDYTPLTLR